MRFFFNFYLFIYLPSDVGIRIFQRPRRVKIAIPLEMETAKCTGHVQKIFLTADEKLRKTEFAANNLKMLPSGNFSLSVLCH